MTPLVYLLFLGGKGRDKNGNEITPENVKNLSLFKELKFSLYNMIVFRKIMMKRNLQARMRKFLAIKLSSQKRFKIKSSDG